MTQTKEYLQGYAKGLDVISEAIRHTTYGGEGEEALQNMLNGVIEAIHYNRGVISDAERELSDEPEFIFGEITEEIEKALASVGFVISAKGGK